MREECVKIVEELYNSGVPVHEIARRCGASSASSIYSIIHLLEREGRVKLRRQRRRKYTPVSDTERKKIVELYRKGFSVRAIARLLDRPDSTIYAVLKKAGVVRK